MFLWGGPKHRGHLVIGSGGRRPALLLTDSRTGTTGAAVAACDSAVNSSLAAARVEDVAQMASVNVRCWQEAYPGLMSDAVLDDAGFLAVRERFWTAALTDHRYRVATA
jgi:hypothetical protein